MTFSIVAHCPRTGQLGVAVSTAVPAVGSMCPSVKPGVDAVSTQAWVNAYLAIDALPRTERGEPGPAALALLDLRVAVAPPAEVVRMLLEPPPRRPGAGGRGP